MVASVASYPHRAARARAIGFGTAYTMPAATAAIIEAAPAGLAGTASGTLNASRQIGSTLGVAIFGVLGYHVSAVLGGAVFAAGAVIAWRTVPRQSQSAG